MVQIRCCLINPRNTYRGIDREVDMKIFNCVKNQKAYDDALQHYLNYLSAEEENTPQNLDMMFIFIEFISKTSYQGEVILYDTSPVNSDDCCYLGVDIIDSHLKSIIKEGINKDEHWCSKNQYGLYSEYDDAKNVADTMKQKSSKYSDLYCVYVYSVKKYEDGSK